jgi:hypothetical protein
MLMGLSKLDYRCSSLFGCEGRCWDLCWSTLVGLVVGASDGCVVGF